MLISKENLTYLDWEWIKKNLKKYSLCDWTNILIDESTFYTDIEKIEFYKRLVFELKYLFELEDVNIQKKIQNLKFMKFSYFLFKKNYTFSIKEILQLQIALYQINILKKIILKKIVNSTYQKKELEKELKKIHSLKNLNDLLYNSINTDGIKDTASNDLIEIRKSILKSKKSIFHLLNKILSNSSYKEYLQENIIIQRNYYYGIPLKKSHKRKIPGIFLDESKSTTFIHPNIIMEENIFLNQLYKKEEKEIKKILKKISLLIFDLRDQIIHNFSQFSQFNLSIAKAIFSIEFSCSFIKSNTKKRFNLIKAQHPILMEQHKKEQEKIVPLHIFFNENKKLFLLSGVNTGGKSLTLKTIGLFCLMNQFTMLCPANSNSEIPIFHKIFILSGDLQNIYIKNSSFSGQLLLLKSYLEFLLSKENIPTLLLLDEPLSNTNPEESSALTISFLYEFLKKT